MKAEWIIDGEGPNPDFDPPPRVEDPAAYALYRARVPHTVRIPAGTIVGVGCAIGDGNCWMLCCPDASGEPRKGIPGLIYCKPVDDECREVVDHHYRSLSVANRALFDKALKRAEVVRKEQLAASAKAKAAGDPEMPLHPALALAGGES